MKFILIVDDNDQKANAIRMILVRRGVETTRAMNAEDALAIISAADATRIGAIITDWGFPEKAGDHINDDMGQVIVVAAKKAGLPVAVVSAQPEAAVNDVEWFHMPSQLDGLKAWIEKTVVEIPELLRD